MWAEAGVTARFQRGSTSGERPPQPTSAPVMPLAEAVAGQRTFDVVVDFVHDPRVLTLCARTRFGVWRLDAFASGAGYREAFEEAPVTPVVLTVQQSAEEPPRVVARVDHDTKFPASRHHAFLREKAVPLVMRELARLHQDGAVQDLGLAEPRPSPSARSHVPRYLTRWGGEVVQRFKRAAGARLGRRYGGFYLKIGRGTPHTFDPAAAQSVMPPSHAFWADPFLFETEDGLYVFYEDYDYRTGLGHIAVARTDGDRFDVIGDALRRPYHLSFPFVFRWNGDIWMIPETIQAARIEVWRARAFPLEWELVATALEGTRAADTVLAVHENAWWVFTNIFGDIFDDYSGELHVYRADSPLLRRLEPHPLNPVVVGSCTARNGGRVFHENGRLYRTSQENSHGTYGYGLNVMEITALDLTCYEETRVRRITPDFEPGIIGCHHCDAAAGVVVFDVRAALF
ncbi:hypothetical protein SAMN05421720_11012 [Rhodospira trueperi]|uniref:Glucosamine inositolphosphorylceramide transferase 1 N-terminal domain-containing protein n=1 Tax=Rhodospira trueperi TaxID=69960 RepID=A0A1G7EWT1_9PROT|nr:hypothetical protein SAMN05421720_11012 [Rhodospira trueperi]